MVETGDIEHRRQRGPGLYTETETGQHKKNPNEMCRFLNGIVLM